MTGRKVDISKAEAVYLNMITDAEAWGIIHKDGHCHLCIPSEN